jgi:hypothetical protein
MYARLAKAWKVGVYPHYVSESLSSIEWCLVYINILASKIGVFHTRPQNTNFDFFVNGSNDFDQISVIYTGHLPK